MTLGNSHWSELLRWPAICWWKLGCFFLIGVRSSYVFVHKKNITIRNHMITLSYYITISYPILILSIYNFSCFFVEQTIFTPYLFLHTFLAFKRHCYLEPGFTVPCSRGSPSWSCCCCGCCWPPVRAPSSPGRRVVNVGFCLVDYPLVI